jgi:hypothetical protein
MAPHEDGNVRAAVDLYWIPLGAGDASHCVRGNGRLYESVVARRERRRALDLYHSALVVCSGAERFVIEMAPVWGGPRDADRGVVSEGAVGLPWLRRSRYFRYEVRCWRDGHIPDIAYAVASPVRLSTDAEFASALVRLVPAFPVATWGRDELGTGDMWNSNSLVSWLLAAGGHDTTAIAPPPGGRAPGWQAGLAVATRTLPPSALRV